jgi:predicted HD phosphohydrolase
LIDEFGRTSDVGHLHGLSSNLPQMAGGVGILHHETVGAEYLRALGASERVCALVAAHVSAKRYLCATRPAYHSTLSDASKATLKLQGGVMNQKEVRKKGVGNNFCGWWFILCRCVVVQVADFEAHPDHKAMLLMRTWDEKAKKVEWKGPELDSYIPLLRKVLNPKSAAAPSSASSASATSSPAAPASAAAATK